MADDPTLTSFSVALKISALWRAADAKARAEYEEEARLDKERYLKEKRKIRQAAEVKQDLKGYVATQN